MAYRSVYEGAAEGFESGVKLGLDVRRQMRAEERQKKLDAEHEQDRAWTSSERERQRRIGDEDREWTTSKRELDLADNEIKDLGGQMSALAQQYGGFDKVPPEQKATYTARTAEARRRKEAAAERVYGPIKQRYEKHSREILDGLQNGTVNLDTVPAADVYRALAGALKRDPRDLLRDPAGSSPVGRGVKMVTGGLETQDWDQVVAGANIVLQPELRVGVGSDGPEEGTTIDSKELQSFVPGQRPGTIYPVLRVGVSRPDGAKGHYFAPVTHDRSTNGKSRVKSLDVQQTLDKMGRLGMLEELANSPALRAKIEQGAKEVGGELTTFLDAAAYAKSRPGKFTTTSDRAGDRIVKQTRNLPLS